MKLGTLTTTEGQQFVLLPLQIYSDLRTQIDKQLQKRETTATKKVVTNDSDYVPFDLDEYVRNPIARARIKAGLTQTELAKRLKVSQPYIAKLEAQSRVKAAKLSEVLELLAD